MAHTDDGRLPGGVSGTWWDAVTLTRVPGSGRVRPCRADQASLRPADGSAWWFAVTQPGGLNHLFDRATRVGVMPIPSARPAVGVPSSPGLGFGEGSDVPVA